MFRKVVGAGFGAVMLVFSSLSVAVEPNPFAGTIEQARLVRALKLDGEVFHVQGLALDGPRLWVTSVDQANQRGYLHLFERATGKLVRRIELTDGARYHPGGISLAGGALWVPVAEMKPHSSAVLIKIDTRTLQIRHRIAVADHLGCVAAADQMLVAGNWDSEWLYEFDLAHPGKVRIVKNPSPTHFQDMKFVGRQLVASGTQTWWSGTVDWIDWPTGKVTRTLRAGAVGPIRTFGHGGPFTAEGMAIEGHDLYVLPEDGPSRIFHFRLQA